MSASLFDPTTLFLSFSFLHSVEDEKMNTRQDVVDRFSMAQDIDMFLWRSMVIWIRKSLAVAKVQ